MIKTFLTYQAWDIAIGVFFDRLRTSFASPIIPPHTADELVMWDDELGTMVKFQFDRFGLIKRMSQLHGNIWVEMMDTEIEKYFFEVDEITWEDEDD